jgi:ABC-type dipeptide/oligopeptide/nickel transport system permease component
MSGLGLIFGAALVVDYIFKLGGMGTLFISLLPYNVDGIVQVDTYALMLLFLLSAVVMITASTLGGIVVALLAREARLR